MEAILVDCVQNSLRHFMYRNAIFMCERLCAEFPSEVNLQLLAGCYLHNDQAYCAYHILKGTQMPQSRYLFAISCFQMDLLKEAESALCSANEPGAEVPNGAAGHYLLGLIYRYTDRKRGAIHHFKQALSADPLLWAAYEELCALGSAEEAAAVFGEAAAVCIHRQYLPSGFSLQNSDMSSEDQNFNSTRRSMDDVSPRQLKQMLGNNARDVAGSHHGTTASSRGSGQPLNGGSSQLSLYNTPSPVATQLSGAAPPPPPCRNLQPNGPNLSALGADSSPRSTVNSTIQAPRRKFVDEGKLRKISGRLFSDSGLRRSTRLAGEAVTNATTIATSVAGNGASNSSKYLGSSKPSAAALRAVTIRKGQSWASENYDEGDVSDQVMIF
ncbi:KOW domain-containing protein [Psidium guajava]|nr:KOW domain-containing protein [Psidium guajava]